MTAKNRLMLGTRKGLLVYTKKNDNWQLESTSFLGVPVSLTFVDTNTNAWWACLDHGHWGCKLHKSMDEGKNWEEIDTPKYPEGEEVKEGVPAAVRYLWAFASNANGKSESLYIGTEPGGLFESQDNGLTFQLNQALWNHPSRKEHWFGGGRDFAGIHSIVIDPRDRNHIYIGISCAGVFETQDGGKSWLPKNKGLKADFLPDDSVDVGHDPHLLVASPSHPDILWQQNHCGIFISKDGAKSWEDVSQKEGPACFGFAIAVDEKDPNTAWVAPAVSDETRVAVDGALCISRTEDGGKTWQALRKGLPQKNCFDIVYRHALGISENALAFGTTTGNLYWSSNRGESWDTISHNLPMVYAVDFIP